MSQEGGYLQSSASCQAKIFKRKEIVYDEDKDVLGSGGFGVVYRCRLANSRELAAIKRLTTPYRLKDRYTIIVKILERRVAIFCASMRSSVVAPISAMGLCFVMIYGIYGTVVLLSRVLRFIFCSQTASASARIFSATALDLHQI